MHINVFKVPFWGLFIYEKGFDYMIFKRNDIELYYRVIGSGKPLLLLHGNGEDHHTFDVLVEQLKHRYTCYQIDSRCHGKSSHHLDISFDLMRDDILAFCQALNLNDIDVIGFSDGGIIGLKLAIKQPQLIHNLYILGANFHPKGIEKKMYKQLKLWYKKEKSPIIKLMINEPHISVKQLKKIKANTFIFAGEFDVIKRRHTHKLHRYIEQSQCYIIKGHTHESYVMNSDLLNSYIK